MLKSGSDKTTIKENTAELIRNGYKPKVAAAAAHQTARNSKKGK